MLKTNEKVYVKSLANFILAGYFILRAISVCACGQMNSLETIPHTYENKYQSQLISLYFASYSWKLKPGFSLKRENPETSLAASRLFFSSVWKKKNPTHSQKPCYYCSRNLGFWLLQCIFPLCCTSIWERSYLMTYTCIPFWFGHLTSKNKKGSLWGS